MISKNQKERSQRKENYIRLKPYLLLWSTQALSALGSGMTSYALVLWLYLRTGSALQTALLSVCSYAPYVLMSVFAGALCDRWDKKRTMLACDLLAAASTVAVLATALFAFAGIQWVIAADLITFGVAFLTLWLFIRIPEAGEGERPRESLPASAGAVLGWLTIPVMNANMDVIFRTTIPLDMQGRVFACRNTMQFFTIPIGFLLGGALTDGVFEPLMAAQPPDGALAALFGAGKGSGAAMLFAVIGVCGVAVCLGFGRALGRYRWSESG